MCELPNLAWALTLTETFLAEKYSCLDNGEGGGAEGGGEGAADGRAHGRPGGARSWAFPAGSAELPSGMKARLRRDLSSVAKGGRQLADTLVLGPARLRGQEGPVQTRDRPPHATADPPLRLRPQKQFLCGHLCAPGHGAATEAGALAGAGLEMEILGSGW